VPDQPVRQWGNQFVSMFVFLAQFRPQPTDGIDRRVKPAEPDIITLRPRPDIRFSQFVLTCNVAKIALSYGTCGRSRLLHHFSRRSKEDEILHGIGPTSITSPHPRWWTQSTKALENLLRTCPGRRLWFRPTGSRVDSRLSLTASRSPTSAERASSCRCQQNASRRRRPQ
jgi:hypothetical protein